MKKLILVVVITILSLGCDRPNNPDGSIVESSNQAVEARAVGAKCEEILKVEFKPSWKELTNQQKHQDWAPIVPYTLEGEKVPYGRYISYTRVNNGGERFEYLLPYESKCDRMDPNIVDFDIADGLVFTDKGSKSVGIGDLGLFRENPPGSGKYVEMGIDEYLKTTK